ncbi:uncharacterized protein LOC112566322 [Pomacea canaliculata]|uniref:uncharacterized protein LOC112566322 n=1 Tax=Pomacea canaliculata TaxID=400727 RepID=UPI000D730537|nr:uncharacterized protein LOC112566322 [Pomacea canaliculata]
MARPLLALQIGVPIFSFLVLTTEVFKTAGVHGRSSSSGNSVNVSLSAGAIVGIVFGVVGGIILMLVLLLILKRLCRRWARTSAARANSSGQMVSYSSSSNNGLIKPTPSVAQVPVQSSWPSHPDTRGDYYGQTFSEPTESSLSYSSPFGNGPITSDAKAGWQ